MELDVEHDMTKAQDQDTGADPRSDPLAPPLLPLHTTLCTTLCTTPMNHLQTPMNPGVTLSSAAGLLLLALAISAMCYVKATTCR